MQTFIYAQAEKADFEPDILDACSDAVADGINNGRIVEATFQELANLKAGSICGGEGNTCFQNIATKYPDFKVRGFIFEDLGTRGFVAGPHKKVLVGQVIVFTGELDYLTRAEATKLVKERGGAVENTVTKKTTTLVATKTDGVKYKKALKLGITIWTEEDFFNKVDRFKEIVVSSITVFIGSDAQGEEISKLAKEGEGWYRYDDGGPAFVPPAYAWRYFETE